MKKIFTLVAAALLVAAPALFTSCDDDPWYDDEPWWYGNDEPWWYGYGDGDYGWNDNYYNNNPCCHCCRGCSRSPFLCL